MSTDLVIGDWGSTHLRLWRLSDGEVTGRREGPGILAMTDHAEVLAKAMGDWRAKRIVLCGMAGARGALRETPYAPCPSSAGQWVRKAVEFDDFGFALRIAAGISRRDRHGRPDVMRGEETQVFGATAIDPALVHGEHFVVLPGTHSKWVRLKDGGIADFRTFMTGELFALLAGSSLFAAATPAMGDDEAGGFSAGLTRAGEAGALSSALFEARAAQLLSGRSDSWARGFVSGMLIGVEVSAMAPCGLVSVIGAPELAARYGAALEWGGAQARQMDGEACAIAGLRLLNDG